jgi:histone deacetylase complex regulatory component SIN3
MSDPETGQRRRLEEIDALRYLDAVQRRFKEAPEYYDRFLDAMTDHKNGV